MLLTLFPIQAFAVNDLPNDDYSAALTKSVDNGLLVGYDNSLHPDKIITRAEMVTVVNRAFGASEQADISKFGDVGENDWFYNDMRKSVAMGVLVGDGKGLNPLKDITREEAFVILSRALGVRTDGLEKEFKDLDKVSNWAKKSIDGMISAGYIKESNG